MKKVLIILLGLLPLLVNAQSDEKDVEAVLKSFHQAMVKRDSVTMLNLTDTQLNYGHSNGWIQSRADMVKDMASGLIDYHQITEDSMTVKVSGNTASARFTADMSVTLRGVDGNFHLRVLEVWLKKENGWKLFARQAVK